MNLWTAQYTYSGADRLDITYKTADMATFWAEPMPDPVRFYGQWLAPTEEMVKGYKWGWKDLKSDYEKQLRYTYMYNELMGKRWTDHAMDMFKFIEVYQSSMTIVCYCKSGDFCHRLLATQYMEQLGAQYMGER